MFRKLNTKGFTLIELMIVIAIIGILAAIAIPNFIAYRNKAFCSAAESDANALTQGLADYYAIPAHTTLGGTSFFGTSQTFFSFSGSNKIRMSGPDNARNSGTIQGNVDAITVTVTDGSGRCPDDYQEKQDNWDSETNIFTKTMGL